MNDVFLMSSVLQEIGFDAEDIRVVLDERATRAAIRERIDWLLDGTADGQERLLYYSGHGAQLPDYNAAEKIDHVDECLVPYDFHWTQDSAITTTTSCSTAVRYPTPRSSLPSSIAAIPVD